MLLDAGAYPNVPDEDGDCPLLIATREHEHENVAVLLERGANPNAPNRNRVTPLLRAARDRQHEIARLLRSAAGYDGCSNSL